ncbi:uncharacterized protein ARMOST_10186 [Armillaria ostoyae]|uniref:Uncharacterized protein n=1 Tax=Armillaria ostoyae TaxID=47428 RepID=A0A284RDM0_ARMOS|nr:uncharacterized protein ARMOST_10186 [Armillaria ostoyae]
MSPALQCHPSTSSIPSSPPTSIPMAPHQTRITPAPTVVVAVALLVVVVLATSSFCSPSRAKMVADVESPDVLHTLGVCGSRLWQRLASMLMWRVAGQSGWGWGPYLWPRQGIAIVVIIAMGGGGVIVVVAEERT